MAYKDADLEALVQRRIDANKAERRRSRLQITNRTPLQAEDDPQRRDHFARRVAKLLHRDTDGLEAIQGDTIDFVDANFLQIGAETAKSVAQVLTDQGRAPVGTGFLIGPTLFITNNHVLLDKDAASEAWIAFNYELGEDQQPLGVTCFRLAPEQFYLSDSWQELDFTIVAIGERVRGDGQLDQFGFCRLSDRDDKHAKGAAVNIIQHPQGQLKKVVLRENRIVARADRTLHYEADTEPGSSGSPVFNDAWEVVALHHWGKPHLDTRTVDGVEIPITVNEGIRVSAIVDKLRAYAEKEKDAQKRALARAAIEPDDAPSTKPQTAVVRPTPNAERMEIDMDNLRKPLIQPANTAAEATLVVPLEVRFRILGNGAGNGAAVIAQALQQPPIPLPPMPPLPLPPPPPAPGDEAPERLSIEKPYDNRRGYDAAFLPGVKLPLPKLPKGRKAAPLDDGGDGGELKYEHFSVVMNPDRRMAFFTATNVDGATYINIDRSTGLPSDAEGGDAWFDDDRMDAKYYLGQSFYGANSTYFDRGHLTRRSDPTWGTKSRAVRANADTFHRTNCTPQHWLFNEGTEFWQGVERYYLEFGATVDKSRLAVLQGPVFGDDDPVYEDDEGNKINVPLQFWKLVVRVTNDEVKSTALLVSQADILDKPRRGVKPGGDGEKPDVSQWLTSVKKVEQLTGLDFGKAVRDGDTFGGPGDGPESLGDRRAIKSWKDFE